MKVMISQPMEGLTSEEIKKVRDEIMEKLAALDIEVVNTYFEEPIDTDVVSNEGLYYLGKSIQAMSHVHALYMAPGWNAHKGCRLERQIATDYGLKILESTFIDVSNNSKIGLRGSAKASLEVSAPVFKSEEIKVNPIDINIISDTIGKEINKSLQNGLQSAT